MAENPFWAWLASNDQRLRDAVITPRDDDPLFDEVLQRLHRENTELFFLMGGEPDGEMEFIITAEGATEHFAAAEALVASAPQIPRWSLIALKPPMGHDLMIRHEGAEIDGEQTWFRLNEQRLELACGSFHAKAKDAYQFAAIQLLDAVLGERLAAELASIKVVSLPPNPEQQGYQRLERLIGVLSRN